jgi:hypothetical protein
MQEAMLSCVDIYKPSYVVSTDLGILNYTKAPKLIGTTFTVMPKQMSLCKLPMKRLCKMANSVMGVNVETQEYCHLIANQTTRATWQHSYGNEIGRLAQGMPGCNTSINTIVFIKKNQVPEIRAKDMTCGLITCLIRPEKIEEPNQTRLVMEGNRVHYSSNAGTPTTNLLTVKLLINSAISTPNTKYMTIDIKDFYFNTLSRTQKSSNRNLLYREMSTRSGSNLVLSVPINFCSYTCNNIYYLIVSIMYRTFLNYNLLYQVMSTRNGLT